MGNRSFTDVGGTPGGIGHFLLGFWSFWGGNSFGITLLPMLFGVGILFWNGKNWLGWLLTVGGALFILAGIIANMHIYLYPSPLR